MRTRKPFILIGVILLFAIILGVFIFRERTVAPVDMVSSVASPRVELKGKEFMVAVADSPQTRAKGLSGTASLAADHGMFFSFDAPSEACFWMKDMQYNLDILWFDADRKLIYKEQNLFPASYPKNYCPPAPAKYVLELAAGTAAQLQVSLGDPLNLEGL